MDKWYKNHQGTIWLATLIAAMVSYAYTTFATVDYVDKKHQDVITVLSEIKDELKDTRNKVYDLNGEVAPKLKEQ